MRLGWSIKDAGRVLGVHPKKAPQAMRPAIRKFARLLLADPEATLIDLLEEIQDVKREDAEADEREIAERERMLRGGRP